MCDAKGCSEEPTTRCDKCDTMVCRTCARIIPQPSGRVRIQHVLCPRKNGRRD